MPERSAASGAAARSRRAPATRRGDGSPSAEARPAASSTRDATAAALDALRRIVRALRVSARSIEDRTGLRAGQLFTLQLIAASPGQSLSELARRTITDRTSAAGMVDRLEARGLVERRAGTTDRRRTEIFATALGRRVVAGAPRAPAQQVLDGMAAMEPRELRLLARTLGALVGAMGIADEPAPMLFEDPADGATAATAGG